MKNTGTNSTALISSELGDLTDRAYDSLQAAAHASSATSRYALAHDSALRAAAALLSRLAPRRGNRVPRSTWAATSQACPELVESAAFFEETARRSRAATAGVLMVSAREADDLVREAEIFLARILVLVGLPARAPIDGLTPVEIRR